MRTAALVLVALALSGCETTAEKSAKLERQALSSGHDGASLKGLSIAHASAVIRVVSSGLLHSSEGAAVTITLRNSSDHALADIPLAITVRDRKGSALSSNSETGLAHSLTAAPLIPAHGEMTWIDDQVAASAGASAVTATVGEGTRVNGSLPKVSVEGAHLVAEPGSGFAAEGRVVNDSEVPQRELVVYATALRGSRIVAAGRAVLAQVPGRATIPFQLFFIGSPTGARLQLSAPPSTLR